MPNADNLDRSIGLLTPENLAELLGWANSHVRKFAENALHHKLDGWNESFGKDGSYAALAGLLALPGGRAAAEAICHRAKIKCVAGAISKKAKQRIFGFHGGTEPPAREQWPRLLAEAGAPTEAAWVIWWDHGLIPSETEFDWLSDHPAISVLLECPPATACDATLSELGGDTSPEIEPRLDELEAVRNEILVWIKGSDIEASDLAMRLRQAAERLDQIASQATEATRLKERRQQTRAELLQLREDVMAAGGSSAATVAASLSQFIADGSDWSLPAAEDILARKQQYVEAASTWRDAMDQLAETHDYEGVSAAHDAEEQLANAIIERLSDPLANVSVEETQQSADQSEAAPVIIEEALPQSPVESFVSHNDDIGGAQTDDAVADVGPEADDGDAVEPDDSPTHEAIHESDLLEDADDAAAEIAARRQRSLEASASALDEGRYGLATHVAVVTESEGVHPEFGFNSALLAALTAGLTVGVPGRLRSVEQFSNARPGVEELLAGDIDPAIRLMAFAASLRPALFASSSGADQILRNMSGLQSSVPAVHGLAIFAANNVRRGDIVPADLALIGDKIAPRAELEALRHDTERFLMIALRRTIKFQPATAIWVNVLRSGPVFDALNAIIADAPNAARLVGEALDSTLADIDRFITDRDRDALGGRKREPLTAKPRATLRDWLHDVAARLENWRNLHEALQRSPRDRYNVEHREELKTRLETASAELDGLDVHGAPALSFARDAALEATRGILALFESGGGSQLLTVDEELLLFEPPVAMDDVELWTDQDRSRFYVAAKEIALRNPDFDAVFKIALKNGRFERVELLRDRIVAQNPARDEALERIIRGERDRQFTQARSRVGKARSQLNDLLGADDRQILSRDLSPSLDELEFQIAQNAGLIDLAEWSAALDEINAELESGFQSLLGPLLLEVDTLERAGQNVSDLRKMIELRDLGTLTEHVEAYKHGATPPPVATDLLDGFNAFLQAQNKRVDLPSLQRAIDSRGAVAGADFAEWEEAEIDTTKALLKAWRELKENDGNHSPPQLRSLFQSLLATSQIDISLDKNPDVPGHYQLRTPVFTTREECVVPAFGSEAKGRYEIVLVDRRNIGSGVELATLKGKLRAPTFFVARGAVPGVARRAFMQRVRSAGANPACGLIDEATILFLATRRGWQRSDAFGLSLACGVVQPYSDTPQKTSPEMFFGRSDELRELWDPNGSCLVYGGRQLGKTALLRQIELRHDRTNQIVEYGDDEVEEFTRQGLPGFWRWIGNRAESRGIPIPSKRAAADVQQAIRDWIAGDVTRRLIFLIDEADKFLSSELRSNFRMLLQLRELMRVTDRRCKFIFAGLHDVQRLARTPNSPLLHFGTPIRVGPLMGKDLFEARNMVEQPMAAAGYAFGSNVEEGRALMGRALSEVGYYPSLMQTFGMVLVNRMNARAVSTIVGDPPTLPIRISGDELNAALDDSAFRNNVRDKFDKTLDLDPRYRLIAYLVLIGTQKTASRDDMRPGMSIAEIQNDSMFWWPQGFVEDSSNSAFEGLLKEMEGLGVLVGLADGRFAIRSARIGAMLGSVAEVEDRIQELADQPYEVVQDTGSLRRALGKAPSPLTFRQEAVLMEARSAPPVTVVLTSKALGLDLLPEAIEELTRTDEELLVVPIGAVDTVPKLERAITTVAARTRESGRHKGLLIASGPWLGMEAVAASLEHPEVRRAKRLSNQGKEQGVRVILLPSMIDWRELAEEDQGDRLWGATLVSLSPLHDASLREWLERRTGRRTIHPGAIEKLRLATGGFPEILAALGGDNAEQIVAAAEDVRANMIAEPENALAKIGLGAGWLRQIGEFVLSECDGSIAVGDYESVIELMNDVGLKDVAYGWNVLVRLGLFDRTMDRDFLSGWQLNPLAAQLLASRHLN